MSVVAAAESTRCSRDVTRGCRCMQRIWRKLSISSNVAIFGVERGVATRRIRAQDIVIRCVCSQAISRWRVSWVVIAVDHGGWSVDDVSWSYVDSGLNECNTGAEETREWLIARQHVSSGLAYFLLNVRMIKTDNTHLLFQYVLTCMFLLYILLCVRT